MACCTSLVRLLSSSKLTFQSPLHGYARLSCPIDVQNKRNPGGIRFGSAELYDVVDMCFAPGPGVAPQHAVVDCLAVGQSLRDGVDERVVLFVKLAEGCVLTSELEKKLRSEIRAHRTARHVPERVSGHYHRAQLRWN